MEDRVFDQYKNWLYGSVTKGTKKSYSKLFDFLMDEKFYSKVPNDDNRGEDGKNLRYYYASEVAHINPDLLDLEDCTCLEMFIAISRRMADTLFGSRYHNNARGCFWELMGNLKLVDFYNENLHSEVDFEEVSRIIENLLARKYERNGSGGLFPLKNHSNDQRKVEIWYQMMAYLDENYSI